MAIKSDADANLYMPFGFTNMLRPQFDKNSASFNITMHLLNNKFSHQLTAVRRAAFR